MESGDWSNITRFQTPNEVTWLGVQVRSPDPSLLHANSCARGEKALALQVAGNAVSDGVGELGEFITGWCLDPAKPHPGSVGVVEVNTVVDGMLLLYGWEDASAPEAKGFLPHEE